MPPGPARRDWSSPLPRSPGSEQRTEPSGWTATAQVLAQLLAALDQLGGGVWQLVDRHRQVRRRPDPVTHRQGRPASEASGWPGPSGPPPAGTGSSGRPGRRTSPRRSAGRPGPGRTPPAPGERSRRPRTALPRAGLIPATKRPFDWWMPSRLSHSIPPLGGEYELAGRGRAARRTCGSGRTGPASGAVAAAAAAGRTPLAAGPIGVGGMSSGGSSLGGGWPWLGPDVRTPPAATSGTVRSPGTGGNACRASLPERQFRDGQIPGPALRRRGRPPGLRMCLIRTSRYGWRWPLSRR